MRDPCQSKVVIRQVVTIVVQASKIVVQTPKTWHSTLPSASSEFDPGVEHGGFEPPTPCLPGKGGYPSASSNRSV